MGMKSSRAFFPLIFCGIILTASSCIWTPIHTTNWNQKSVINDIRDNTIKETKMKLLVRPGVHRFEAPEAKNFFLVHVPYDYTPKRAWPVIFCYHGAGGSATTWPFQQLTQGRGFIIVGMNYMTPSNVHLGLQRVSQEKTFFDEALTIVSSHLNINPEMVFMGG